MLLWLCCARRLHGAAGRGSAAAGGGGASKRGEYEEFAKNKCWKTYFVWWPFVRIYDSCKKMLILDTSNLGKAKGGSFKKGEAYRKWLCHIQFNLSVILLFYWDLYFCTKRFYCHVLENSCTCTRHAAITKSLSTCKKTTKRTLAHAFFCHGLVTSPCVVNRDTRMDQELSVQSRATGPRDESVACMSSRTLCTQVAIFARVSAKGKQLFCWRHSSKHCCNVCNSSMCSLCTRPKWCICGLYFAFRVYPGPNLYFWSLFFRNLYFWALSYWNLYFWPLPYWNLYFWSLCSEISTSDHFPLEISTPDDFSLETSTSDHFSLEISTSDHFSLEISTLDHFSLSLLLNTLLLKSLLLSTFL